ncbi:hypothetical protein ExPCM17_04737 [Escherichia coli]|nr:hypothetical protein ExPCM17_04737 [Escherichia coli]GDU61415.1 hypothetical protein ExPUPEC61_03508 [Escherichia coli]
MACKRPSTPRWVTFTPAKGQRISSMSSESMTLPFERSNAPGSKVSVGSDRLPLSCAGKRAYKMRSACFASPVSCRGSWLLSMLNFPGPKFNTALPLPACPWVSTLSRPLTRAFSSPACQLSTLTPSRPLKGKPAYGQLQRPSLTVNC